MLYDELFILVCVKYELFDPLFVLSLRLVVVSIVGSDTLVDPLNSLKSGDDCTLVAMEMN